MCRAETSSKSQIITLASKQGAKRQKSVVFPPVFANSLVETRQTIFWTTRLCDHYGQTKLKARKETNKKHRAYDATMAMWLFSVTNAQLPAFHAACKPSQKWDQCFSWHVGRTIQKVRRKTIQEDKCTLVQVRSIARFWLSCLGDEKVLLASSQKVVFLVSKKNTKVHLPFTLLSF